MSFDPFQRECLAAMGYAVYQLADQEGAPAPAAEQAQVASPPFAASAAPGVSGALLRALLRAIGGDPADAADVEACRALLPSAGLPDARARRALWPRLRALRARAARG